jgi:hypothetical protein
MVARVLVAVAAVAALLVLVAADGPIETGLPRNHVYEAAAQPRRLEKLHDNPTKGRGNFLASMEWFAGSDPRPSPRRTELLTGDRNPADPEVPKGKLGVPRRPQSYDVFSAALVRAYTKLNDPTNQAAKNSVRRYQRRVCACPCSVDLAERLTCHAGSCAISPLT